MKSDTSGLFTRIKSNPVLAALVLVLIASFGLAIWIFFQIVNATERDQQYLQITSELRASSYRLTSLSRDAIGGDEESFNELQKVVSSMDSNWQQIKGTDQQTRVVLAEQIAAFDGVWNRV